MDDSNPEASSPVPARELRIAKRLQGLVDGPVVAWTQGWVSRDVRMHGLIASRTLDFAVLTDRSLSLITTGFFTRQPRRRVFWARLEEIAVTNQTRPRGLRLQIRTPETRRLLLELRDNDKTAAFAAALVASATSAPEPEPGPQ
jgi:hypothetical protein